MPSEACIVSLPKRGTEKKARPCDLWNGTRCDLKMGPWALFISAKSLALLSAHAEPRCVKRISQKIRTRTMSPFLNGPTELPTKGVPGWIGWSSTFSELSLTRFVHCVEFLLFFLRSFLRRFSWIFKKCLFWFERSINMIKCLGCYDRFMGLLNFFLKIYR